MALWKPLQSKYHSSSVCLPLAQELQSTDDFLWNWWWCWQMITSGLETVLIGNVVHPVAGTVIANKLVVALGTEYFIIATTVIDTSRLGHLDVVLVQEPIEVPILVQLTGVFLDAILATAAAGSSEFVRASKARGLLAGCKCWRCWSEYWSWCWNECDLS